MLILSEPKAWEKFCELYALGRHESNYAYDMNQCIELVELIKKAEPVNTNANMHREFYEVYIEFLNAILENRRCLSPLFYMKHDATVLTPRKESELRDKVKELWSEVAAFRGTRSEKLLVIKPVSNRRDLLELATLLYVVTSLYGVRETETV